MRWNLALLQNKRIAGDMDRYLWMAITFPT